MEGAKTQVTWDEGIGFGNQVYWERFREISH